MRRLFGTILFCFLLAALAAGFAVAVGEPRPDVVTQSIQEDLEQDRVEYVKANVTNFEVGRQFDEKNSLLVSSDITLVVSGSPAFDPHGGDLRGDFRLQLMKAASSEILDAPIKFQGSAVYDDFVNQRSWHDLHFVLQPTHPKISIAVGERVSGIMFIKAPVSKVTYALKLTSTTVSAGDSTDD
jgi:hypothetical protein